jgi:hypothetical protein
MAKRQTTQWPKEEGQTTQWPKEKGQQDKQRSTKHYTNRTKNRGRTQVLRMREQFLCH